MGNVNSHLPVIFCFAGQGSQYYRMAEDLLTQNAVFRHWMQLGDAIVAKRHGFSVLDEIYGENRRTGIPFDRMAASHPAIFLVQYALAKALQDLRLRPDMLLGVSLGEFTAQCVAGMTPFETAVCAVADQPALFQRHCPPGGMISVLAPPDLHARSSILSCLSHVAGINSDVHFVLSALKDDLPAIESELKSRDVAFQRLPVPFAFHSRFIDDAEQAYKQRGAHEKLETPFWPVWSACTGALIQGEEPDLAWRIVRQTMNVRQVFDTLEGQGGAVYVDLSPSGTLAALIRQGLKPGSPSKLLPLLSPFGGNLKRLEQALASLVRSQG